METYTVFVASPGDVSKERQLLQGVIDEINETHGEPLGYRLRLWRYEEDGYPSASKPQEHINAIRAPYQIFVGIMWKRFGTPTPQAGSGTEEEYNLAYKAWQNKEVVDILFYFCKKQYYLETPEEYEQVGKVLKFKNEMNGRSLIWNYDDEGDFEGKIRKHLCRLMNEIRKKKTRPENPKAVPDEATVDMLKQLWPSMAPELKKQLSISYNENRMRGDGGIQTKDLLAAMITRPTPGIDAVVKHIPGAALPEPIQGKLCAENYIIDEQPWLSHCISSSLKRLGKALPKGQKLTALDMFADIARHGTGESVRLLRKHNITPDKIEQILKLENLQVVE